MSKSEGLAALEMWGGVECTINRVRDAYFSQLDRSGHAHRDDDIARFAALGIKTLRYPVLWEATAPDGMASADWSWADRRLGAMREIGVAPITGLVHHGSGPRHTHLLCPRFAEGLAEFAGAVAERYPWIEHWTPVNEPLTTARFSALYGVWYPHARDNRSFVTAVLNQCRATVLSMAAIRRVNPRAQLVQTDDLSVTDGTPQMRPVVEFYNERRWLAWDLLCGRVDREHPLWNYLLDGGADPAEVLWFAEHRCAPDIIGANYYITSDRWLDHRVHRYPGRTAGGSPGDRYVDIESVRVLATPAPAIGSLLKEAWQRYGIPVAVTEAHLDAGREDQLRWLHEIWRAAQSAREAGADVRAVTAWSLLGSFDWNCLLAECHGYYEPGPFDLRAPQPRPTALAAMISELAAGQVPSHPVAHGKGWWRRADRYIAEPIAPHAVATMLKNLQPLWAEGSGRPILISGAEGPLARAFATLCQERNIACRWLSRSEMDWADPQAVAGAIERWQPWAVIEASGHLGADEVAADERHPGDRAAGLAVLADACRAAGIRLLTFSSDQVFDGWSDRARVESELPAPITDHGRAVAAAERVVLMRCAQAMVVRTGPLFGPWDAQNFAQRALAAFGRGEVFHAATNERISPTYLPDLVHICIDLLIDGEVGLWHLANVGDVSWAEWAERAAELAGVTAKTARGVINGESEPAIRPLRNRVLASERASLMPSLDDALRRFAVERLAVAERRRSDSAVPARHATPAVEPAGGPLNGAVQGLLVQADLGVRAHLVHGADASPDAGKRKATT